MKVDTYLKPAGYKPSKPRKTKAATPCIDAARRKMVRQLGESCRGFSHPHFLNSTPHER